MTSESTGSLISTKLCLAAQPEYHSQHQLTNLMPILLLLPLCLHNTFTTCRQYCHTRQIRTSTDAHLGSDPARQWLGWVPQQESLGGGNHCMWFDLWLYPSRLTAIQTYVVGDFQPTHLICLGQAYYYVLHAMYFDDDDDEVSNLILCLFLNFYHVHR